MASVGSCEYLGIVPIRGGCFLRDRNPGMTAVVVVRAVRRSLLRLAPAEFADAVRVALIERKAACRVGELEYREAERRRRVEVWDHLRPKAGRICRQLDAA